MSAGSFIFCTFVRLPLRTLNELLISALVSLLLHVGLHQSARIFPNPSSICNRTRDAGRVRRLPSTTHRMRHVLLVSRSWIGNNTQSSKFPFSHWLFFALFLLIDDPDAVSAFFCLVPYLATPPTLSLRPPSHSPLPEFQLGVCWPVLSSAFHHFAFGISFYHLSPSLFVPFARAFRSATSRSCSITPQLLHPPILSHSVHFRPRGQPQSTVSRSATCQLCSVHRVRHQLCLEVLVVLAVLV